MLFNEVYGVYYQILGDAINLAIKGDLNRGKLSEIVKEKGFAESNLVLPAAILDQKWPLIDKSYNTSIKHEVTMPMTRDEKQWLKALLLDPRMKLFGVTDEGLEDVEPLFTQDMFVYFDQYTDGDPYDDEAYIQCFRKILAAIRERKQIWIEYISLAKEHISIRGTAKALEYSEKDDRFRLRLTLPDGRERTINLSQINDCGIIDKPASAEKVHFRIKTTIIELVDERKAMERAMLHFSHFEKETEQIEEGVYRIKLRYQVEDENEVIIRLISFGPMIRVISPEEIVNGIHNRIQKQLMLRTQQASS